MLGERQGDVIEIDFIEADFFDVGDDAHDLRGTGANPGRAGLQQNQPLPQWIAFPEKPSREALADDRDARRRLIVVSAEVASGQAADRERVVEAGSHGANDCAWLLARRRERLAGDDEADT